MAQLEGNWDSFDSLVQDSAQKEAERRHAKIKDEILAFLSGEKKGKAKYLIQSLQIL